MFTAIWLIDDDPINNLICQVQLEAAGLSLTIRSFESATEALEALQATPEAPELILLDLNMPLLDGWGFLQAARSLPQLQASRIVILTSSIHERDRQQAASYPEVSGFFSKPLTPEHIHQLRQETDPWQTR